ncbi:MAG: hypothetical protein BWK73_33925 [Thiothrix lacustris]|uniref:DarT domain-containing protein n=1 Tax=Thiothrix lacustris TaxID=525917 RepID=A0A1Y1QH60_9GAMM|nr:MAG: hypothetical protein BWK73_33925 [Thiothrix lacustris]
MHCGNSQKRSEQWITIGNTELISKRADHPVPLPPGGTLNDYVPFYFTPFSVMLRNIHTGWGGVQQRNNDEIVILVSSLHRLHEQGVPFLFTDSHAYYRWANFYEQLSDLDKVDWALAVYVVRGGISNDSIHTRQFAGCTRRGVGQYGEHRWGDGQRYCADVQGAFFQKHARVSAGL